MRWDETRRDGMERWRWTGDEMCESECELWVKKKKKKKRVYKMWLSWLFISDSLKKKVLLLWCSHGIFIRGVSHTNRHLPPINILSACVRSVSLGWWRDIGSAGLNSENICETERWMPLWSIKNSRLIRSWLTCECYWKSYMSIGILLDCRNGDEYACPGEQHP